MLSVARSAARGRRDDAVSEFVTLVEKAARLSATLKPEEHKEKP